MKKVLIGVGVLLVLILAGVLVAPSFIDWNQYRDEIAGWVEKRTGRQLDIAGGLSLSLLPTPTLVASDVAFANDPEGTADHLVRMEKLAVRVALGPLLGGNVQVESVRLVRPQLVLEILPGGRGNWRFEAPAERAGGPVPPAPGENGPGPGETGPGGEGETLAVALEKLTIEDGSILWRDAEGAETRIEAIEGEIAAETLQGPFAGDLAMTLRGSRLTAGLRTGRFAPEAPSTPVTLTLGVPDAGGTAQVQGRLSGAGPGETAAFEGTLTAESPSLGRTLAAVQGVEGGAALDRPFRLSGNLGAGPRRVALDGLTLRLGETEGSGAASLDLAEPPRLDVALAFTRIDLDTLLREARAGGGVRTAATTPPPEYISPTQAAAAEPAPPVVPGDGAASTVQPLVPALPADLTGSIDVTADLITWRGGIVRSAVVSASLADGEVTLNQASALLPGSSEVNAFGFLNTRADPAAVDGTVEIKSSNLRELLAWTGADVAAVPADRLRHLAVTGAVQGTTADLAVPSLEGVVDTTRFTGALALRPLQERPAFGLSLSVDALNLDAYLPRGQDAAAPAKEATGPQEPQQPPPRPEEGAAPDAPAEPQVEQSAPPPPAVFADLAVLNTFDANIKARAGSLIYRGEQVRDARLDVTLLNGVATFGETVVENLAGSRLGASGGVSGFGGTPEFKDFTLTLRSEDPQPLARLFDLDLPEVARQAAPVALSATVTGNLSLLAVATTNELAGGSFTGDGTVSNVLGTPSVDMAVAASHDNVVGLARRLGMAYEPQGGGDIGPLALTGRLTGGGQGVTLSGMSLRAGPSTLTGELSVTPTDPVPTVVARLDADRLPIEVFLPAERRAAVEEFLGGIVPASFTAAPRVATRPLPVDAVQAGAQRWSREPLDLSGLDAVRLDLALTSEVISYEGWRLSGADVAARLADGRLEVPKLTGALFGGPVSASALVVRTGDGAAGLELDVTVQQMDIGTALEALQGERAARGRMDFRSKMRAAGDSEYALVSSLDGEGALALSKVDMRRVEDAGGSALASLLAPLRALDRLAGVVGGESYGVDLRGDFTIDDGILRFAEASPLVIESNLYGGTLHGAAALPAWTVDARGEVRLAQNALTALLGTQVKLPDVVPVVLSGPLDSPDVKILTGRQGGDAEAVKPEKALRDMLKQALPEEVREALPRQQDQQEDPDQPSPKPEKVLRDTLKNMLFQ